MANRLPQKVGGIALTHMLNRRGRIELETTIVKLAEDRYYLVCAAFFEQRLLDHLDAKPVRRRRHRSPALSTDWAALSLNGPKARDVLAACTDADLSNAGFRWLTAQEITVAGHKVWAFRMSYAGELGWEFHMPRDAALDVYDALWAAGEAHGITDYGSFAMNVMRMEKGFKGAGELTNEVTLPEADVMRFAKLDKDYLGLTPRGKAPEARDRHLPWVCAYLEIDPDGIEDGHGGEAVLAGWESRRLDRLGRLRPYGRQDPGLCLHQTPCRTCRDTAIEVIIAGNPSQGPHSGRTRLRPQRPAAAHRHQTGDHLSHE